MKTGNFVLMRKGAENRRKTQRFKFLTPYIPFSEFLRYLRANITLCEVLLFGEKQEEG
jgi:hypothetical protein